MYIEQPPRNQDSATKMSDGVNDATAALKSMMGLGGTSNKPIRENPVDASEETKTLANTSARSTNQPKKPYQKGSKKQKDKNGPNPKNKERKKKNQKAGNSGAQQKTKQRKDKSPSTIRDEPQGNFALSAFQSSPDPSTLPLPVFGSFGEDEEKETPEEKIESSSKSPVVSAPSSPLQDSASPELPVKIPVIKSMDAPQSEKPETLASAKESGNAKEISTELPVSQSVGKTSQKETEAAPFRSGGGINIAALASAPKEVDENANQNTARTTPSHQPVGNPSHFPNVSMPLQYQQQYVTIQVQVPPQLLPGRTMIVHSPAGYPVRVVVPESVPPGMVIPVSIPAYAGVPVSLPHHTSHQYNPYTAMRGPQHGGAQYGAPPHVQPSNYRGAHPQRQ